MADNSADLEEMRSDELTSGSVGPRGGRRLGDKLLVAFHQACDLGDLDIAESLLKILETLVTRGAYQPDTNRRRNMESLVAAHERLWHLRHQSEAA